MKKFFISLLKALGYFGIYLGAQFLVTFVYMIFSMIPVIVKYSMGGYDLANPEVFNRYLYEVTQPLLDATMPITIISGILTIGVVCLIFACRKKKITKELSLRKISGGAGVSVAMFGFGLNFMLGMLMMLLPETWIDSYEETASATFAGEFWIVALTVGIMAPLVEEFVFRGLIYTRLKQGLPMAAAAVITAVWFGAMHGHPLWVAYASLLGLIMIWIFERTRSLYATVLFHFGYNLVAVISMALPENTPDWVGIIMLAVGAVFTAAGIYWFMKFPKVEPEEEIIVQETAEAVVDKENGNEEPTETLK